MTMFTEFQYDVVLSHSAKGKPGISEREDLCQHGTSSADSLLRH